MGQSTRRNRRTAGLACFLSEGADGLGQGPWEAGRVGNSMGKSPGRWVCPRWSPGCGWLKWVKENIGDEGVEDVESRCVKWVAHRTVRWGAGEGRLVRGRGLERRRGFWPRLAKCWSFSGSEEHVRSPAAFLGEAQISRGTSSEWVEGRREFIYHETGILLAKLESCGRGGRMDWWEDTKELHSLGNEIHLTQFMVPY